MDVKASETSTLTVDKVRLGLTVLEPIEKPDEVSALAEMIDELIDQHMASTDYLNAVGKQVIKGLEAAGYKVFRVYNDKGKEIR